MGTDVDHYLNANKFIFKKFSLIFLQRKICVCNCLTKQQAEKINETIRIIKFYEEKFPIISLLLYNTEKHALSHLTFCK